MNSPRSRDPAFSHRGRAARRGAYVREGRWPAGGWPRAQPDHDGARCGVRRPAALRSRCCAKATRCWSRDRTSWVSNNSWPPLVRPAERTRANALLSSSYFAPHFGPLNVFRYETPWAMGCGVDGIHAFVGHGAEDNCPPHASEARSAAAAEVRKCANWPICHSAKKAHADDMGGILILVHGGDQFSSLVRPGQQAHTGSCSALRCTSG